MVIHAKHSPFSYQENIEKEEKAVEDLRQNITDINELIKRVKENVTKVENKIPQLNITMQEVKRKYEEIEETINNNVTNSIEYVKYLIANSRSNPRPHSAVHEVQHHFTAGVERTESCVRSIHQQRDLPDVYIGGWIY